MFEFAKKVFLKHICGIPDGFRTEEAKGVFKDVKKIKLLSVEGRLKMGFPGLSRIGIGKTVELTPNMYLELYGYGERCYGHTFRYKVEQIGYELNSAECYLDIGYIVEDGVRKPENYMRVTYDAPNPRIGGMRTVGRCYSYEYLGDDVVRAYSDTVRVELKLLRD